MQRWWYLEEKSDSDSKGPPAPEVSISSGLNSDLNTNQDDSAATSHTWKFNVLVNENLTNFEQIAITGDCTQLGKWDPTCSILLQKVDENNNLWTISVDLPAKAEITYRYFICAIDPTSREKHVRKWETHLDPRQIDVLNSEIFESNDTIGDINGLHKIDRGWLTTETIIQFKFCTNPFSVKRKLQNKILYVKITPMNLRIRAENSSSNLCSLDESMSNDTNTRENQTDQPAYAFTEVVSLKGTKCQFEPQPQFGRGYYTDDILIFNVTVAEPENVAYLIDLFAYSSRTIDDDDDPPSHLGYHYILPNLLRKSEGILELPITCATKHQPLGMMLIKYLKIKPQKSYKCDMKTSYIRYWNRKWKGLDVGHRGSGTSFKTSDGSVIRENTIASLKKAALHGADMVEFDVQLSRDLVPVIYHDFLVYVSLKKKKILEDNDMLELPMRELTLEQLKNLKVYHVVEAQSREQKFFDEDLDEHQPFPQLAEALDVIDINTGFNIEIKWSQQYKNGAMETMHAQIDRNLYVDCILKVVMCKANGRRIVFSCFDPDICTMVRYKQNKYPVMFLTQGVTEKYPSYLDDRCNTIEKAVQNACAMELLGIVAHTEDILRDPSQVHFATDEGLIIFCWGEDNNSKEMIDLLKRLGLHAIIYDKMDVLSPKDPKTNIFLVGTRNVQSDLVKIQQIELERRNDENECYAVELNLQREREKCAVSNSSSVESVNERDDS